MRDNPQSWQADNTPVSVFNPLLKDLTFSLFNEKNESYELCVPSMRISTYPKWQADLVIKRIKDQMIGEKGISVVTPDIDKELEAEIIK